MFKAGETWTTRGVAEGSLPVLVIGAIVRDDRSGRGIAACAVWNARAKSADGIWSPATIPFLPIDLEALTASVVAPAPPRPLPDEFMSHFETWRADPRGLSVFTIPFEGTLDGLIARQMAAIAGVAP